MDAVLKGSNDVNRNLQAGAYVCYASLRFFEILDNVELLKHRTEVEAKEDTIHQCRAPTEVTAETIHVDLMAPLLTFCNA